MWETEQELVDEMVKVYRKEVESAVKKINAGEVKRLSDMEEEVSRVHHEIGGKLVQEMVDLKKRFTQRNKML